MEIASKLFIINMIDTQQTASVSNIVTTEIQDNSFLLAYIIFKSEKSDCFHG